MQSMLRAVVRRSTTHEVQSGDHNIDDNNRNDNAAGATGKGGAGVVLIPLGRVEQKLAFLHHAVLLSMMTITYTMAADLTKIEEAPSPRFSSPRVPKIMVDNT